MLRTILSVSGKPGLFKLISQGKNMVITESLLTGKRQPIYSHEKIISLGDIAIYCLEDETPLKTVFQTIQTKEAGKKVEIPNKDNKTALVNYFADILPTFDRERVYPNDIKKIISWYNALVEANITDFEEKANEEEATTEPEK